MTQKIQVNKVSRAIREQVPEFIDREDPQFVKFLELYYKSQEKTGLSYNILNNLSNYLNIDEYDLRLIDSGSYLLEDVAVDDTTIVVEDVYGFVEENGTIKIDDEIIFYEKATKSPNVAITDGISYSAFVDRWVELQNPYFQFDSNTVQFALKSGDQPITPPGANWLIVKEYDTILIPGVDYEVSANFINFTQAPRTRNNSDTVGSTSIFYLKGFNQNPIRILDSIASQFDGNKKLFDLKLSNVAYTPVITEYTLLTISDKLLIPNVDYSIYGSTLILKTAPPQYATCNIRSIEAPIPSFGSGATAVPQIDNGQLVKILPKTYGTGYVTTNPPKVSISSGGGKNATAVALVSGVSKMRLLSAGRGYSTTNPPIVEIESPGNGGTTPVITANVENGTVTSLQLVSSGSNYNFTPRVSFKDPGGAEIGNPLISNGSLVSGSISVINSGIGYSTPPVVYIDPPNLSTGIQAVATTTIVGGKVTAITITNLGTGYTSVPRVSIIDPTTAKVLEVQVDPQGRVIEIDLLSGGTGFTDIPSIYIIDERRDTTGQYIGGVGAKAIASIFNGAITDITITSFGEGYDPNNPPKVFIQRPPVAEASVEIEFDGITDYKIIEPGSGYSKAQFEGCARGVAGPIGYDERGNIKFQPLTTITEHTIEKSSKADCLDGLFLKKMLTNFIDQYLPDLPKIELKNIDVNQVLKNIREFYQTKGTSNAVSYLFKLLYQEDVSIFYPREQIIKPSAAIWSVDTIIRTVLVSGNPEDLIEGTLIQEADAVDLTIGYASALIENYLTLQTSETTIYELILAEETILGKFAIPYKTRLAEKINETDSIITVDSTIGWPERNGEILVGNELIQYKEKSLNQFIECTRSMNNVRETWDAGTLVKSNFTIYVNKGQDNEVQLEVLGIAEAGSTTLSDTGSYYLAGDKLSVAKLGATSVDPKLTTWVYNVKKLLTITSIEGSGRIATALTDSNHGLLVGDAVTIYGANPIVYNGTFRVISINPDNKKEFQYQTLSDTGNIVPQGSILVSIDLNKGRSSSDSIYNQIKYYTVNVQNAFFDQNYVYVASTGLPNYNIGPFGTSALIPGNQRKLNRFFLNPQTISSKSKVTPGAVGTFVNGVSVWSYISKEQKTFGPVTSISVTKNGQDYDADNPPVMTISTRTGETGSGAKGVVIVDGSITSVEVTDTGSGYTTVPLVSIVGGNGSGAAATAIISQGKVTQILVTSGGTGYTNRPSISISGGGGSGATAEAKVRGPIKSVTVSQSGSSYSSSPVVSVSSGQGALAQPIISNGRIISIAIINAGTGYTTPPNVFITGSGFGAVARAVIDTDGENAGRVTSISIVNRGIGYSLGTTNINLVSVGTGAEFTADVFKWTYNLQETLDTDSVNGYVFDGYNTQYGGEYGHVSNPQRLRYVLGDSVIENEQTGNLSESDPQTAGIEHSPIIGWAYDGNPIYGPYGYSDPTDQGSEIQRMITSYKLKDNIVYNALSNPNPSRIDGPPLDIWAAGQFIEDYEYVFGQGDLDQYNGRFCKTPDYPNGTYAYFITMEGNAAGTPVFPYIIGPSYNSIVDEWNLNRNAVQQNIPKGVIRYRDPFESVDIDVERKPNAESDTITTESGDLIVFEVADENGDGIIDQSEQNNPPTLEEESILEIFDYFPRIQFDSRVDIEVETTTKFEEAKVTGFLIENPGESYQVNDRLVFDNENTGGSGVAAEVSSIQGKSIESYTFETINDIPYGVITTDEPHEITYGDKVDILYEPQLANSTKQLKVRVVKGIEKITVQTPGTGYNKDVPIEISIDGDGIDAEISPVINPTNGTITEFEILNSGSGFTKNPRILISHPQSLKKADYFIASLQNQNNVKVLDMYVTSNKVTYVCGETVDSTGNVVGFATKYSALGVKQWSKTFSSKNPVGGFRQLRLKKLAFYNTKLYVVGEVHPNITTQTNYNPDVFFARLDESADGLSASVGFSKGIAGISGSTRADQINTIKQYTDNRFLIGGHTNTNTSSPNDAFVAIMTDGGEFVTKRKLASTTKSESIKDFIVHDGFIYALVEIAPTPASNATTFAISKLEVEPFGIDLIWTKEVTQAGNYFKDIAFSLNEYDEIIVTASLFDIASSTQTAFWVGKFDLEVQNIWNYRTNVTGASSITTVGLGIDIFGEVNLLVNKTLSTNGERVVDIVKIGYDGKVKSVSNTKVQDGVDGVISYAGAVDVSGDVLFGGQTQWNRNEFSLIFDQTQTNPIIDVSESFASPPTLTATSGTLGSVSGAVQNNRLKFFGVHSTSTYAATYLKWTDPTYNLQTAFGSGNAWTLEFFAFLPSARSSNLSQTEHILFAITDNATSFGGVALKIDQSNKSLKLLLAANNQALNAVTAITTTANTFTENRWHHIAVTRSNNVFTLYVNGTSVAFGTVPNVVTSDRDLYFGNAPGFITTNVFSATQQFSGALNFIKLRNRTISSFTVPTDIASSTTENYVFTDTDYIANYTQKYDYIPYFGLIVKSDKNNDALRLGVHPNLGTNFTGFKINRSLTTYSVPSQLTLAFGNWLAGPTGNQILDFANTNLTANVDVDTVTLTQVQDIYSSRTATVPAPGSVKVKVEAKVVGKFFIQSTNTVKIDNIQKLILNQPFTFTKKSKLVLKSTTGVFRNSAYIVDIDKATNSILIAVAQNTWSDDIGVGLLSTEKFDESTTYGITGPAPNDINVISQFYFPQTINTTPGTFTIDMATVPYLTGTLDQYAKFRAYSETNYSVRIDEVAANAAYPKGSVVAIPNPTQNLAFNGTGNTNITITGLTGVLAITLICTLEKKLLVSSVENTDSVYVITSNRHYLKEGGMIFVDGNPTRTVNSVTYDEYDGAFPVDTVVSGKEFIYKLPTTALTLPSTTPASVSIFAKSPVIKMYYGHQYEFDVSHTSMYGYFLSFSEDNLNKLEYSFNSILRIGVPGVVAVGSVIPKVQFKVTKPEITNISYYFDPSRSGEDSPVDPGAYMDVVDSPYLGRFTVEFLAGATITTGPDIFKFPLTDEPEGPALIRLNSDGEQIDPKYEALSEKVVGKIGSIRLVNGGGFYRKLPVVTDIISSRKIERVNIIDPGTEYQVGEYSGIPILGDGEGGLVRITVTDGEDAEGNPIPGQISSVVITSAGKGYKTAYIDIPSIPGILGSDLAGSGAELDVEIPPFGSGASIFTTGANVGKIKKLKNNNFGYDYPHDYTLRPEITFPINVQLINTSILKNITVTNPGSGYSQAPTVIIEGGGGSGATAEASIRNGRIYSIVVKDPGSGYSSEPTVSLKSSFNYVVNLDLGLLQFSYPHGIQNGAAVTLQVTNDGDTIGTFPIAGGSIGALNSTTTYYAIAGAGQSLEPDQLKLAITPSNANLGDAITFVNAGTGRQILLTSSFGGAAKAIVGTGEFLAGEYVYQGDSVSNPTAFGYVSSNGGWEIGPRLLKIIDYEGKFEEGAKITGTISKSSGIIASLSIARGVLQIDSLTKTTGQFVDDRGKLSEIIQRVQDSYYYQTFSYAVQSPVSITSWKNFVLKNTHPAGFKLFGELNIFENAKIANRKTDFELTKSVNLADSAIVPNIQNFALVEPIYTQYDNTQVLFRQKRLTSSENILTSVVQRIDDISNLFDGERIAFPISVAQEPVSASVNQLMIVLNGVVQNPGTSFGIQGNQIVFSEPPQAPASVRYGNVDIAFQTVIRLSFSSISGIFPTLGMTIIALTSRWRGTVIGTSGNTIDVFWNGAPNSDLSTLGGLQESEASQFGYIIGETFNVGATGFIGILDSAVVIKNSTNANDFLYEFSETITTLEGELAQVEQINLSVGQEIPIARLRYTTGVSTTAIEVIAYNTSTPTRVPDNVFVIGKYYQFDAEVFKVTAIVHATEYSTITVQRAQLGTAAAQHQANASIYGTEINVTDKLTLSKTVGTYQSKPGLFDIQLYDIIVGVQSGSVGFVTRSYAYTDPTTNLPINEVVISEGSSFFGLLFNRITSTEYANVILDNIADSQIQVNDFETALVSIDSTFPVGEFVNNHVVVYNTATGTIQNNEYIRNYKFDYGNDTGVFTVGETAEIRQLAIRNREGGYFTDGQIIRSENSKAEVLGFAPGRNIVYLGKQARSSSAGKDFHIPTFFGNAKLSTAQKKFGESSLLLDGNGDYLQISHPTEFDLTTYTFEAWIYLPTTPTTEYSMIFANVGQNSYWGLRTVAGVTRLTSYDGSTINEQTTGTGIPLNTWTHVAWSRSGSTIRAFMNGVIVHTGTSNATPNVTGITIGYSDSYANQYFFNGYIDEVRVSNTNIYGLAFTPPSNIFQGDNNTKLLLHFDGANNATTTDDWSGAANWANGQEFVNSGILFRFYDAANQIEDNINLIAAEAVYRTDVHFPKLHIPTTVAITYGSQFYDVILANLNFIAWEAYQRVSPTPPTGTTAQDCVDDVKDVLRSLAYNIKHGFNSKVWDAAKLYVNSGAIQHLTGQVTNSVNVFNQARNIAKQIINNTTVTKQGSHTYTQTTNTSIPYVIGGYTTVESSIDSLFKIVTDTLQNPAGTNNTTYPSSVAVLPRTHPPHTQCIADVTLTITEILKDIRNGGNEYTWDAASLYVNTGGSTATLNHIVGEEAETSYAYDRARDISLLVMRGLEVGITGDHGFTQFIDTTITDDPANPVCADVASTINTLFDIVIDTIDLAYTSSGNHLLTVPRTQAAYEYASGIVDAYRSDSFTIRSVNNTTKDFWTNEISPDTQSRYIDAADLIEINTEAIIDETSGRMLARYPVLLTEMPRNQDGSGAGTNRCKTDLTILLGALVKDLRFGGNRFTTEATKNYLGVNDEIRHIRLQLWGSLYAHDQLGEMSKLAITGDLAAVAQYTDSVIVSDIGITQDAGGCANVKTTIDNLIQNMNDILAPTPDRNKDAADLLVFNRNYIAEEAIGLLEDEFFYTLSNGQTYQAYQYPGGNVDGRNKCIRDAKNIIDAVAADLLTGGNNSILLAVEKYLTAQLEIDYIEDQLGATLYSWTRIAFLCKKAVANLLQSANQIALSTSHYVAQHTDKAAYTDPTITHDISSPGGNYSSADCVNIQSAIDNLINAAIDTLAPGGDIAINASRMMLFNKNYFDKEIGEEVTRQWGQITTAQKTFIEEVADNIIHDILITKESVLDNQTTAQYSNVQTYRTLRSLLTPLNTTNNQLNLIPAAQVEQISGGTWTSTGNTVSLNASSGPDGTLTADKLIPGTTGTDERAVRRNFVLTAYTTYDRDNVTFDNEYVTLDQGVDTSYQTYTWSIFFKEAGYSNARIRVQWDATHFAFFNINLTNGAPSDVFGTGITGLSTGVIPHGNGWYRAFITFDVPFGVSSVDLFAYGTVNASVTAPGNGTSGVLIWGAKFAKSGIDIYTSQGGTPFYPDNDYNVRNYILDRLEFFMTRAISGTLITPSPLATFPSYTNTSIQSGYTIADINKFIEILINQYQEQLTNPSYYLVIGIQNGLVLLPKTYGTRIIPVPLGGKIEQSSFIYGVLSDRSAEIAGYILNEAQVAKTYVRMRINDIEDGPFVVNDDVVAAGNPGITGKIYGFYSDENFNYLDVEVTAGTFNINSRIESDEGAEATIVAIEPRLHVIGLQGDFADGVPFKAYTSNVTANVVDFIRCEGAVLSNTGGKLTVDTDSLTGSFETKSVVFPQTSRIYLDLIQYKGLVLNVGDIIVADGYVRFQVAVNNNLSTFQRGGTLYGIVNGTKDTSRRAIIVDLDLNNNYIYAKTYLGQFANGQSFAYYGEVEGDLPVGFATIVTNVPVAGNASGRIVDIKQVGTKTRVFLSDVRGTWTIRETVAGRAGYGAAVFDTKTIKGRIKRAFRGFDGVQTEFNLTTANGTPYFPDPDGHMLIFINGILQPPGAGNAYSAFSNVLSFSEPPEVGDAFVGFYLGKLRQLDDISFEFDSLRQSFNLRRSGIFYSLTLTDGVQSSVIRPENNIIVSLNGVIQEPGIGFTLVGSRIIFGEIPRVGSTFVAFSYVGSEGDVDSETVVPPIEPGDLLDIEGETIDREVAVIESSNSLITIDYLGSVFGKGASATGVITKGRIKESRVTSGGSGYTSRPLVRIDSVTGFDANIKALVGVERIEMITYGSGYKSPVVLVESTVPDDWTSPNIALYGADGVATIQVIPTTPTEPPPSAGVPDNTISTSGGFTAGGGVVGQTTGGTDTEGGIFDGELDFIWTRPANSYTTPNFNVANIFASSTS